jgi:glycosidase
LNYYRRLLSLRHTNEALLEGKYVALNEDNPNVLSYARSYKGKNVVVVLNMCAAAQKVSLNLAGVETYAKTANTLVSSYGAPSRVDARELSVEPFGAWVGEME